MAEYLDSKNGINEFSSAYHRKEMKRLRQEEDKIKERIQKKLKVEQYRALESHLDQEASTSDKSNLFVALENQTLSSDEQLPKSISIKSSIFKEGQRLHKLYVQGIKLAPNERHCMRVGLSGIFDLINNDMTNQVSLSAEESWDEIMKCFFEKYETKTSPIEYWIEKKGDNICGKCIRSRNVTLGRNYLDRLCGSNKVLTTEYNAYKFLDTILDSIQNSQHILNPTDPKKNSESDFIYTIWMPLFKR